VDKDWTAGWRACRNAFHPSLPWLLSLEPSLSPFAGQWHQGNGRGDRQGHCTDNCGREEVGHHNPINVKQQKKQKQKQKQNQQHWRQRCRLCA
jgi:hypothetical protein